MESNEHAGVARRDLVAGWGEGLLWVCVFYFSDIYLGRFWHFYVGRVLVGSWDRYFDRVWDPYWRCLLGSLLRLLFVNRNREECTADDVAIANVAMSLLRQVNENENMNDTDLLEKLEKRVNFTRTTSL